MKRYILSACSCLLVIVSSAQKLKLNDLQTPDAPGLILADKAPSSVERPTNPRAFGISLYSVLQGGAVQATPFWFFQQPKFDTKKYINSRFPFFETFNLSLATFKTDTTSVISAGFRSQWLRIYSKKNKEKIIALTEKASTEIAMLDPVKEEEKLRKTIEKISTEIDKLRKKQVLQATIAFAYLGDSKNNSFKELSAKRAGIWTNLSFKPEKNDLTITALGRYIWSTGAAYKLNSDSSFLDFGAALSWQKNNLELAAEWVNRRDFAAKQNFNRLVFVCNYQINDEITLVASFGKNYRKVDNIITAFGVKFGLANQKMKL